MCRVTTTSLHVSTSKDAGKAGGGLAVSIMLAFGLPALANLIGGAGTQKAEPAAVAPAGTKQVESATDNRAQVLMDEFNLKNYVQTNPKRPSPNRPCPE
jgi:hypothetical protein